MLNWFHKAQNDEGGQAIVFTALTLFTLVCFVALVINVGQAHTTRVRMQNAADAAAYSGAMVQANSLSIIAFLNNVMVWLYRTILLILALYYFALFTKALGKALVATVFGAVAGKIFIAIGAAAGVIARPLRESLLGPGNPFCTTKSPLMRMIKKTSNIQIGINKATPALVQVEVLRVAWENNATLAIAYPFPGQHKNEWDGIIGVDEDGDIKRFISRVIPGLGFLGRFIDVRLCGRADIKVEEEPRECPECGGSGRCSKCGGDGKISCRDCGGRGGRHVGEGEGRRWVPCGPCGGDGQVPCDNKAVCEETNEEAECNNGDCPYCYGKGQITADAEGKDLPAPDKFPRPLIVRPAFFDYGVNVVAWRGREEAFLFPNIFPNPVWGHFAIASARSFSRDLPAYEVWRPQDLPKNLYVTDWTAKLVRLEEGLPLGENLWEQVVDIGDWMGAEGEEAENLLTDKYLEVLKPLLRGD